MRLKSLLFLCILFFVVGCTPSATTKVGANPTLEQDSIPERTLSFSTPTESPVSTESTPFIDYDTFIGLMNLPLPDGFETRGGFLIAQHPLYEFNLVHNDGVYSIWFSENKVIKDILVLPDLAESEVIAAEYCQVEEKVDPFIFAIANLDQASFDKRFIENSRITQAWRADPDSGNIIEIPTTGIECGGEGGFDPNNVIYKFSR